MDAVAPLRVGVAITTEIRFRDELGKLAGDRRLDLALVLAQLRLDERQVEEALCLFLRREDP
jgi:hypothetical protein